MADATVVGAVRAGAYKASNMRNYSMMAAGGAALAQINTGVRGGIPAELEASVLKKLEEIRTGAFVVPVDESVPAGSVIR